MKKKILIIHPEGNIFNNPNLYEILIFLNIYFDVNVLLPKLEINQKDKKNTFPCKLIEYSAIYNNENLILKEELLFDFLERYALDKYDFVIGVDRIGIYIAYAIHCLYNIKYGYLSYEIFFEKETSKEFKSIEKFACMNIEFAIIQDKQRGLNLHKENDIPFEKMLYIPVAGSTKYPYQKSYFVYDLLNIEYTKKMIIYTGSIASWSCFSLLFESISIPEDWVLIIHDRYGSSFKKLSEIAKDLPTNVYFLDVELFSNHEMHKILHSADLGLALYCPDFLSPYTGKNISDLGLSSGKISTYLQNGLPIVTTYNKVLLEYMVEYNIGYMINEITELETLLEKHQDNICSHEDCINFFDTILSFKNFEESLLSRINIALKSNEKELFERFIGIENFKSKQVISELFSEQERLTFSKTYNRLFQHIYKLKEEKQTYVIYGNGAIGKTIQSLIPEKTIGYIDIADEKYHPSNLKNMKYDKIIISVLGREKGIIKYLTEKLKVKKEKIITIEF